MRSAGKEACAHSQKVRLRSEMCYRLFGLENLFKLRNERILFRPLRRTTHPFLLPACVACVFDHPSAYCNSADSTTSCLKYWLSSCAVLRSTFLPMSSLSSISIPASLIGPGMCRGSNSTNTSTSWIILQTGSKRCQSKSLRCVSCRVVFVFGRIIEDCCGSPNDIWQR
jgi:hypothetical protein